MRHHVAAAGLLLAVLLVWFHPLLGGDQLSQAHALYVNVPWAGEAPPGIADAARRGEGDPAVPRAGAGGAPPPPSRSRLPRWRARACATATCRFSTDRSMRVRRCWATC